MLPPRTLPSGSTSIFTIHVTNKRTTTGSDPNSTSSAKIRPPKSTSANLSLLSSYSSTFKPNSHSRSLHEMNGNGGDGRPRPGPEAELLLKKSVHFLRNRNFDGCRKYALQAKDSDPTNAAASQILAVIDVLSADAETRFKNRQNFYAILGLKKPYSEDSELIRTRFNNLSLLLNPNKNKFDFALESFELVRTAWMVLSDPIKKAQFDNEFRFFESESKVEGQCAAVPGHDSFWTMCPYCYYVYEYPGVYVECCLRCQNKNCGKGFQAVAIQSPPPPAVVKNGQYFCLGFYPVVFEKGREAKPFSAWTPFGPTWKGTGQEEEGKNGISKDNNGFNKDLVEISDDSDSSSCDELMRKSNGKNMQTEELKDGDVIIDGCGINTHQTDVASGVKPVLKRKKSVANDTKKVLGKGIRVKIHNSVPVNSEGLELNCISGESGDNLGCGIGGGMEMGSSGGSGMDEIQFFEGVDDIFVALQNDF